MLTAALGLMPFTVYSVLLVDITEAAGEAEAVVGGLRGLGGISAIAVGTLLATAAHRLSHRISIVLGLIVLGGACLIAAAGTMPALVAFCLLVGSSTAVLTPMLQAAAADRFTRSADQGRAATMVTATTTLTAVAAGPVIGVVSLWFDWRIILSIVAGLAWVTAIITLAQRTTSSALHPGRHDPPGTQPTERPHSESICSTPSTRLVEQTDVLALIGIIGFRTAAFMGALALMAGVYHDRHQLTGSEFAAVWTASGLSFFVANWFSGRALAREAAPVWAFLIGCICAATGLGLVFLATPLPAMVIGTALLATGHAALAAAATTLLVRRTDEHRSRALVISGIAQSAGTFLGAGAASLGFLIAGWQGTAVSLLTVTLAAMVLVPVALNRGPHRVFQQT